MFWKRTLLRQIWKVAFAQIRPLNSPDLLQWEYTEVDFLDNIPAYEQSTKSTEFLRKNFLTVNVILSCNVD